MSERRRGARIRIAKREPGPQAPFFRVGIRRARDD
jgi:hypothetical protein